jgi:E3 Ubiquitin ligase
MHLLASVLVSVRQTSTDLVKLEFAAAVGAIIGVALFIRGFQMLRYKRLILNTPASKIRSASMGLVEISGIAKGPSTIPAGITGGACYFYRAIAWQLRQSGRNREWKQVACESLYVPFFIEDPTGQLLIDPQGADFDIERNFKDEFDTSFLSDNREMLPENVARFLARNGVRFDHNTRLEEFCIKPDHPLFVFGTLATDRDPMTWTPARHVGSGTSLHGKLSFFGPGGTLAWLGPSSGVSVNLSRTLGTVALPAVAATATGKSNRAPSPVPVWSEVSMDEVAASKWPAAGAEASASQGTPAGVAAADVESSSADATENSAFDMHPSVCLGKGTEANPFLISWRSQREVVRSLAWKSVLCIWGGPALTLGCLYVLALRLGWK